jgi:hypothetical protein
MANRILSCHWLGFATIVLANGCSRTPARYYPPKYDATALGAQAIARLDTDNNQLLDAKELAASPALLADLKKLDRNSDQRLSAEEIGGKVNEWTAGGVGAVGIVCWVTRGGQPVANVQVKFIPETYMGDIVKPATGVTDSHGAASMTAEGQKSDGVMQCGYYRVELSSAQGGRETIPGKFNSNTVLGADVKPNREVPIAFDIAQ